MANTYTGSDVGQAGLNVKKTDNSVDVNGVTEIQLDTNLSLTPNGGGSVTIQSSGGGGGDTYTLQADAKSGSSVPLKLDANTGTDSTVNLTEGSNITLTRNSATQITIESTGGGTISGTIADTQVAYGTAADTIGGDANFTWDSSRELLQATYSTLANVYEVVADVDITKGQAVYTTGFNGGSGKPQVDLAQANSSSTMPAIGIASENILTGQTGLVIIDGQLDGVTTSGNPNDIVYVSPTVAGALTNVRPTGATDQIQNMGNILKVGAGGKIAVTTIGRTNDVPNSFSITGSISADSITLTNPLDIPNGGTNATDAATALANLGGLPTIATIVPKDNTNDGETVDPSVTGAVIICDTSTAGFTLQLSAGDPDGTQFVFINSGGNPLTLEAVGGGGVNINGAGTYPITTQYQAATVIKQGVTWFAIG